MEKTNSISALAQRLATKNTLCDNSRQQFQNVRWFGGVVIRALDLWSTGCEFNCWVITWMGNQ